MFKRDKPWTRSPRCWRFVLHCTMPYFTLCFLCFGVWAIVKHAIRSGVLSPPGLIASEDGSSHLGLQLFVPCLCKRPNSRWSYDATFSALLQTQRDLSAAVLLFLSENIWWLLWTREIRIWSIMWLPWHMFSCSFLITFVKLNMHWFFSNVFILSLQRKRKKKRSISVSLVTCCYCHCSSPFKKQAVIFNQWVINYWSCAGWQDTCSVLFARWIICSQDACHIII